MPITVSVAVMLVVVLSVVVAVVVESVVEMVSAAVSVAVSVAVLVAAPGVTVEMVSVNDVNGFPVVAVTVILVSVVAVEDVVVCAQYAYRARHPRTSTQSSTDVVAKMLVIEDVLVAEVTVAVDG
jgi:hypothetical protein